MRFLVPFGPYLECIPTRPLISVGCIVAVAALQIQLLSHSLLVTPKDMHPRHRGSHKALRARCCSVACNYQHNQSRHGTIKLCRPLTSYFSLPTIDACTFAACDFAICGRLHKLKFVVSCNGHLMIQIQGHPTRSLWRSWYPVATPRHRTPARSDTAEWDSQAI